MSNATDSIQSPKKRRYEQLARAHTSSTFTSTPRSCLPDLFPAQATNLNDSCLSLAPGSESSSSLTKVMLYSMSETADCQSCPGDTPTIPTLIPSPSTSNVRSQQAILDEESQANRLKLQDRIQHEKTTEATYNRQWKKFKSWWEQDQMRRVSDALEKGVVWVPEDSHPITAVKVALYLQYESNRPKVSSGDGSEIGGTRIGPSAVKQCITALEYFRSHLQHEARYRQCPDSHMPLRNDIRICQFEEGAAATESERDSHTQSQKANGIQSDTFSSSEQLTHASIYYLAAEQCRTPTLTSTFIRDRSMLLSTATMAFRGDNIRRIRISDIFRREIRLPDAGLDFKVPTLVIITNKGKENSSGRLDEHGAFRHRIPENCGIGALALHFFSAFHVSKIKAPNFEPDYSIATVNGIGHRQWYLQLVYPGQDNYSPMTLDNHIKRVNKMKADTGIDMHKATHAGRGWTVKAAREGGSSKEGAMSLGTWMAPSGGSYNPVYDRALPVDALLGSSGFNAHRQQSYFVARGILDPPPRLLLQIFPWIEAEKLAYQERVKKHGKKAQDSALVSFLDVLLWFRVILLQDAGVLFSKYPKFPIFQYEPFSTALFREFSSNAVAVISEAEQVAQLQLKNLPDAAAEAMRGMFTATAMKQEIVQNSIEMTHSRMDQNIEDMKTIMRAALTSGSMAKKRKAVEAALSQPLSRPAPFPLSQSQAVKEVLSLHVPSDRDNELSVDKIPSTFSTQECMPTAGATIEPTNKRPDAAPTRTVSLSGNIYGYSSFQLSENPSLRLRQLDNISSLEETFTYEQLSKHKFEWDVKHEDWIPKFTRFWTPPGNQKLTIEDVWKEDKFGFEGLFSIQELNAKWNARWRRNLKPLKTEYSRRRKIIAFIEKLASKPNWNSDLAFRFLHDRYEMHSTSARSLSDYLTPQDKVINEIIESSSSYP